MSVSGISNVSSFYPRIASPQGGHVPRPNDPARPATGPGQPQAPRAAARTAGIPGQPAGAGQVGPANRSAQTVLDELKARDREVRAHEQAHLARAGGLAKGGARYTFQKGPDGKLYAVGGRVEIDASPVPGDPEATIRKARQIRAAALAPASPSAQDRSVAAAAAQMEAQALLEIQQQPRTAQAAQSRNLLVNAAGTMAGPADDSTTGRMLDIYA